MTTTLEHLAPTNRLAGAWTQQTWRALGYLALGPLAGALGLATFCLVVALGVTGSALIFGIPALIAVLAFSRGVAELERRRAGLVLGAPIASPYPRVEGRLFKRVGRWLATPATWRDLVHHLLALPLNLFGLILAASFWGAGLAALSFWAWYWALPGGRIDVFGFGGNSAFVVDSVSSAVPWIGVGLGVCWVAGWLTRGLARMNANWSRVLLGRTPEASSPA
jgi:hypothetical protein